MILFDKHSTCFIKISSIKELICKHYKMEWEDVCRKTNEQKYVSARHAFIYLCHEHTNVPPDVFMPMINKARTSFYKNIRRAQQLIDVMDSQIYPPLNQILQEIHEAKNLQEETFQANS